MIYILYLLLGAFILIVMLHKLNLLPFSRASTAKQGTLEHQDLLTLFDKLNYQHEDGVCHGFTLTWAQDVALSLDEQFYARLNLIKAEKDRIPDSLERITTKLKYSTMLSKKEQHVYDIRPFFEAICLAQSPDNYPDLFAQSLQQSNVDTIYKMIQRNLEHSRGRVKCWLGKTISFGSPREVTRFLGQLNVELTGQHRVAVVCSSEEHTVGYSKHKDNTWVFIDINELYAQSDRYPFQLLDNEELGKALYKSLFEAGKQLVFHCSFIAKVGLRGLAQQMQRIDELFPMTSNRTKMSNSRGFGPLALAIQCDNRGAALSILSLHRKKSAISEAELRHAFFYIAACNRAFLLRAMRDYVVIDINAYCTAHDVPLGIACQYGSGDVVQMLLRDRTIRVNEKNKSGRTPLMIACKSLFDERCQPIFVMLLKAGADVALTDDQGNTAFDIADQGNNQMALTVMAPYRDRVTQQVVRAPTKSGLLMNLLGIFKTSNTTRNASTERGLSASLEKDFFSSNCPD